VIGNSSSGVLEAPFFCVPTVNIGDRQRGRLAAKSVIHCRPEKKAISVAIKRALSPAFRASIRSMRHPYGDGKFAPRALRVLKSVRLGEPLLKKKFYMAAHSRG
jgi:UDP-N-acetylglucosamine 2-epimerase